MASKWAKKLAKGKKQWKKSEGRYQEMFAGKELPEDVYVTKIQKIGFDDGKDDTVIIKRSFVVIEGEHKGVAVNDRLNPFHESGGAFVRKFLVAMGVEDADKIEIESLEEILAEMNTDNPIVKVRVKQGDFTNIEVLSVLDEDDVDTGTGGDDGDGDGGDGEEQTIDLDALDGDALRALIAEQEIDPVKQLGFKTKTKYKKASEKDLRNALKEALSDGSDDEVSEDELMEQAKLFCGTQDIDLEDDADLDDIKDEIKDNAPYKEKDLDDTEKELLSKLELTDCIKVKKKK